MTCYEQWKLVELTVSQFQVEAYEVLHVSPIKKWVASLVPLPYTIKEYAFNRKLLLLQSGSQNERYMELPEQLPVA